MVRKPKGLGTRHVRILEYLLNHQNELGYPPSIREIGEQTGISSTSVVNYYLNQLEKNGYIERDPRVSRGVRVRIDKISELAQITSNALSEAVQNATAVVSDLLNIPVVGRIVASAPVPVPASDFGYYDAESSVEIARSLLPSREKGTNLFALEVQGDSMIDAMVNDGDIVIMKAAQDQDIKNGDMVAVWLDDRDETTLKYFFKENNRIRLQPANPTMQPIIVNNPKTVKVQGKVVMVIRRVATTAV